MEKQKSKFYHYMEWVKNSLLSFIKSQMLTFALKKILRASAFSGIKGWIIKYVVTELYEEVVDPLIKVAFARIGYYYERQQGKLIVKKLDEARENQNEEDYDTAIDDLFNE